MVYYNEADIKIRDIEKSDAQIISDAEVAQGWNATLDKYLMRLKDKENGLSFSLVAEYKDNVAGYINIYKHQNEGPFTGKNLPAIVDFGVLEKYRCHGIGSKLMDVAEQIASQFSDTVFLGVGLHHGYGSAQRMYVKRGYIPDGSGIWYNDELCKQNKSYCNDDDLVLYMSKKLS